MPLPTVSRKVSELEAHLGTQIVIRTSRRLLLTDSGKAFVDASRAVIDQLEEAERAASGEYRAPRGDLLVTAPILFGKLHVTPLVIEFLAAYPDVNVRLVLSDQFVSMAENHVDAAIRIGHLADSGLVAAGLGEICWTTCASPAYLAARGTPRQPQDLCQHACIAFEGLTPSKDWGYGPQSAAETVTIHPRFSANTAESALEAAISGIGIVRLRSYQVAEALQTGRLITVLHDRRPAPIPVHLVHTGERLLPLKLRAFLAFAKPRLRALLSTLAVG